MSILSSLAVAVDLATRKRDDARRALQATLAAQLAANSQLMQLQGYARETEARWGMQEDVQVKPEVMYHHYQFMGRLSHAEGLQASVVGDHEQRVVAARRALLDAELRLASLCKVIDLRRADLELKNARRDQKQTDERAALQYRSASQEH